MLRKKRTLRLEIENAWNRKVPSRVGVQAFWPVLTSLVVDLSEDLPQSLHKELCEVLDSKDWGRYISLGNVRRSPQLYGDARSYLAAQTLFSLFRKTPMKIPGLDPLAKATERFFIAENRCKLANKRLRYYRNFDFVGRPIFNGLPVHEIFHLARRKIQRWLGPVNVGEILENVRHGPGGCLGVTRPWSTPYYKFNADTYTVTTGAYWLAVRTIASCDPWVRAIAKKLGHPPSESFGCIPYETKVRLADSILALAEENKVTFVPKDASTDRAIAVEPMMNVMVQLSIGSCLKERLRRAGCDLSDQTRNQSLALEGSVDDGVYSPCTIDLEMASDTVCRELVAELLPEDWFSLMDATRSRWGVDPGGSIIEWEKFSSMGNGFTFELESLIFYALSQSVSDLIGTSDWYSETFGPTYRYGQVSVYGDDIIVPRTCEALLRSVLRFVGFRVNETKSFREGPFRESCGADFFNGFPVRPFFFKREAAHVYDFVHLHNGLKMLAGNPLSSISDRTLSLVKSFLPEVIQDHLLATEATIGDSHLWVTEDESHRSAFVVWDTDHQSWVYPKMRPKPLVLRGRMEMRYLQFLYANTGTGMPGEGRTQPTNLTVHTASGGSAGDVVRSGRERGMLVLTS